MPFGLMNASATIQKIISSIFNDMLDSGMCAFLDNITIFAKTLEELEKLTMEVRNDYETTTYALHQTSANGKNRKSNS